MLNKEISKAKVEISHSMIDQDFAKIALEEAKQAMLEDEIPVGACLVHDGKVIFRDHNRTKQQRNPLAHAEKLILDKAHEMGLKYLQDYILYVTLEPCSMCAAASSSPAWEGWYWLQRSQKAAQQAEFSTFYRTQI